MLKDQIESVSVKPRLPVATVYLADLPSMQRQGGVAAGQLESVAAVGLAGKLDKLLSEQIDLFGQGQGVIAGLLGLSPRVLQRRLQAEQTSYQLVLDRVRFRVVATWLCESDMAVSEMGSRLGYIERTGFAQAFKRWAGVSPMQYRQRHAGRALKDSGKA